MLAFRSPGWLLQLPLHSVWYVLTHVMVLKNNQSLFGVWFWATAVVSYNKGDLVINKEMMCQLFG